jgi:sialic acid synthase SpsE
VIDQAPYHTMIDKSTKNPSIRWRKNEIISWIQEKNVALPDYVTSHDKLTKAEIIVLSSPYFQTPVKRLEILTQQHNIY